MNISMMQQRIAAFVEEMGIETEVEYRLLDLVSEVGELSKEVLTNTKYGGKPFSPGDKCADEFGDALFS